MINDFGSLMLSAARALQMGMPWKEQFVSAYKLNPMKFRELIEFVKAKEQESALE